MLSKSKDLKWLEKAEHCGEWIRFSETELAKPESIWMMQGTNGKIRFYAVGKGQVGIEHKSLYAAACWAWAYRWLWTEEDGSVDILMQLACRKEVIENSVPLPGHKAEWKVA